MRLIDADALNLEYEVDMADDWKTAHEIANIVKYAPTIDAEPVRRGKWIATEEYHGFDDEVRNKALSCSVCRIAFRISDYTLIEDFRYCPNCGARMDEE